jgi:hypothetical protein
MATNDRQVPWPDKKVIQEDASQARVTATLLPLNGPLLSIAAHKESACVKRLALGGEM